MTHGPFPDTPGMIASTLMPIAMTRDVSSTLSRCELTYRERQPIDLALARDQHEEYRRCLGQMVSRVVHLSSPPEFPDAVFIEDTAVVLDQVAVITRPGARSRRGECLDVEKHLSAYRELERITAPATLEGGDVVRLGRKLFVGLSARTNRDGVRQFQELVEPFGYRVTAVEVRGCLHLKSACTALGEDRVIAHRAAFDVAPWSGIDLLEAPAVEPRGANVLALESKVIVSQSHPQTAELLAREGFAVISVDNSELLKAEAGVTCSSLVFVA